MIANTTRVQVPTGEKGTVIEIAETATGTTALVRFDESGVTATGTARYNVDTLVVLRGKATTTKARTVWYTEDHTVLAGETLYNVAEILTAGLLGMRWVFMRNLDTQVVTVKRIRGGFANVVTLEGPREITAEELQHRFPSVVI